MRFALVSVLLTLGRISQFLSNSQNENLKKSQQVFVKLIWNNTFFWLFSLQILHNSRSFQLAAGCSRQPRPQHGGVFYPAWAWKAERPQRSQSSGLAAVHAARALHASASAPAAPCCVSSLRPLCRSGLLCNEVKHFDPFGTFYSSQGGH